MAGARCTVELSPRDAFGDRDPELFVEVERGEFPEAVAAGDRFDAEQKDGIPFVVQVLEVTEAGVLVDMNHPLAGQRVRFEVEVLEARPATAEEVVLAEARLEEDPGSDPEGGSGGLRTTGQPLIAPASLLRRGSRR
jgi:FKBP-type peptidyl-prolyl cis-trans isomerase SlyD